MMILKTILLVVGIILLVVIILVLLLLIIPFKYKLELYNENGENYGLSFKYLIINLKAKLLFKPKFSFKLTLMNKTLVDTSVEKDKKKKEKEKESIEKTDFIKNKGLEKEIDVSKNEVKKLFLSAKKAEISLRESNIEKSELKEKEKYKEKAELIKNSNFIIDKFKILLPKDLIYVIKRIVAEGINVLDKIRPNSCKVDIKFSDKDPYTNGIMMAFAGPIYAILGDKLKLNSNDKDYDTYKLIYTGRPVLITLFGPILRLLFDKKVREFIFKKK